jgi:predicted ATPase
MRKHSRKELHRLSGPLLDTVKVAFPSSLDMTKYPFSLDIIKNLSDITFPTQVTFFVGENGAGKSTLLEAIAQNAGFGLEGGSKHIAFTTSNQQVYSAAQRLADCLTLSWRFKPHDGYFFRAESFYNVANYLDSIVDGNKSYGGKSLHAQSHGESFFAFFSNRMGNDGFFILDEPEAALSPQRQLALLCIIHQLCKNSNAQFIIATHSPILLAYPDATIYSCDSGKLTAISYADTEHYKLTKQFLNNPAMYLKNLFAQDEDNERT